MISRWHVMMAACHDLEMACHLEMKERRDGGSPRWHLEMSRSISPSGTYRETRNARDLHLNMPLRPSSSIRFLSSLIFCSDRPFLRARLSVSSWKIIRDSICLLALLSFIFLLLLPRHGKPISPSGTYRETRNARDLQKRRVVLKQTTMLAKLFETNNNARQAFRSYAGTYRETRNAYPGEARWRLSRSPPSLFSFSFSSLFFLFSPS